LKFEPDPVPSSGATGQARKSGKIAVFVQALHGPKNPGASQKQSVFSSHKETTHNMKRKGERYGTGREEDNHLGGRDVQ
jgi:hypothetical protein